MTNSYHRNHLNEENVLLKMLNYFKLRTKGNFGTGERDKNLEYHQSRKSFAEEPFWGKLLTRSR